MKLATTPQLYCPSRRRRPATGGYNVSTVHNKQQQQFSLVTDIHLPSVSYVNNSSNYTRFTPCSDSLSLSLLLVNYPLITRHSAALPPSSLLTWFSFCWRYTKKPNKFF